MFSSLHDQSKEGHNICDDYIDESFQEKNYILTLCKTANSILQAISSMHNKNLDAASENCKYLSYWLYYEVKKNNNITNENIKKLYDILVENKTFYYLHDNRCNLKNFDMDTESFNNKKQLYFHFEMLKWIQNEHNYDNKKILLNNYLKECVSFYKEIIQGDSCQKNESYKQELRDFFNTFKNAKQFLSQKSLLTSTDDLDIPDIPTCSTASLPLRVPGGEDESTYPSMDFGRRYSSDEDADMGESNDGGVITTGISFSIFLGISLMSFFFYKFTPFGSYVRNGILKNKNMIIETEEETHNLLLQNEENENMNLEIPMYRMQYNSVQNF
ncbi:Plasmodium vivax Vir protein/Plasmodium variant antigen protein Cir/Yir/Bir, putative [Plasmodium ovale]|uniref:Plasmodium vivax Vir protein/Plasmodium variant antigen protein Cir/Yir/Bir, putative n=1 Tax=Plasmodium ovale TaxID=36330 RepID=A0A1C3KKH4_PLAOA|nr:Plasmodium vivax Vir protein/Plasmodium variant antigen protein Cir/Yir/Bir, putative [Plasmodium ovale]